MEGFRDTLSSPMPTGPPLAPGAGRAVFTGETPPAQGSPRASAAPPLPTLAGGRPGQGELGTRGWQRALLGSWPGTWEAGTCQGTGWRSWATVAAAQDTPPNSAAPGHRVSRDLSVRLGSGPRPGVTIHSLVAKAPGEKDAHREGVDRAGRPSGCGVWECACCQAPEGDMSTESPA